MKIFRSYQELKQERAAIKGKLAFVPTMGALHNGHLALVQEAKKYAENVVISIFVNPTQFGKNEDFGKYPRTIEDDIRKLENIARPLPPPMGGGQTISSADCNLYLYLPSVTDIYPNGEKITVKAGKNAEGLDGTFRPNHFDGVCTVVSILFDQVQPTHALFGEKDFQQLMVIREMCYPNVEIIGVPTLREPDGLAMSSRNVYLSADERKLAPLLYKELCAAEQNKILNLKSSIINLEAAGFKVQYLEQRWNRLLVAAYLGSTRLIDNIPLK